MGLGAFVSKVGNYALVRSNLDNEIILDFPLVVVRETPNTIIVQRVDMPATPEKQVKNPDVLGYVGSLAELESLKIKNQKIKELMAEVVSMKKDLLKDIAKLTVI